MRRRIVFKTQRTGFLTLMVMLGLLVISCSKDTSESSTLDEDLTERLVAVSQGQGLSFFTLPESDDLSSIPQDPLNPLTAEKIDLGRFLFHETGIAMNPALEQSVGMFSCASCHHAGAGFKAGRVQGIGEGGLGFGANGEGRIMDPSYPIGQVDFQKIASPTLLNGAFQPLTLWNGQFGGVGENLAFSANWPDGTPLAVNHMGFEGLETQAIAGIGVHRLECTPNDIIGTPYEAMFDAAFPDVDASDRYTNVNAGLAIAAYERTVMANQAPFQYWLKGNQSSMTEEEKEGALLFFGKARCYQCHNGPALNDMEFHAYGMKDLVGPGILGVPNIDTRHGRGGFTGLTEDHFKFKTPQLYSLGHNPFLGHGSSFSSVRDVVEYKNSGIKENPEVPNSQLSEEFTPLNLSASEIDALVEFIEHGLNDSNLERYVPISLPTGNCFPNADDPSRADLGCE